MPEPRHPRRRFLQQVVAGAGAVIAVGSCGCTPPGSDEGEGENKAPSGPPGPPVTRPISEFPLDQHVTVLFSDHPVEVVRTADGVVARSLLCTHWGCRVAWVPADNRYACACHKGLFDAQGDVIAGPAVKPMLVVPARIEGDTVVVGAAS